MADAPIEPHAFVPAAVLWPEDSCTWLPPSDIQCGQPADAAAHHRLDADEQAWLDHELTEHPEVSLEQAMAAVTSVRPAHLAGVCS